MCCLLFYQMAAFDVMDHDVPCVFCAGDLGSGEEERVLLLQCCLSGAHHACLRDKFPDWNFVICPKCDRRTRVTGHVLRRDKFTPEQADKIEYCFVKHQAVRRTPMTSEEIHGLRIALNVRGFRAMRHVSHRVFAVGLTFWFPLPKDKLCDWEDIVARLTLGLIWNMVSEMRDRYARRVQREGRGDAFHHFVDYLLQVGEEDDEVPTRDCVVQTCKDESCTECQGFASVFDGQRFTDRVAMANRSHLYQRVNKELYNSFMQMITDKKE